MYGRIRFVMSYPLQSNIVPIVMIWSIIILYYSFILITTNYRFESTYVGTDGYKYILL